MTSHEGTMKGFANYGATLFVGWVIAIAIAALNALLTVLTFQGDA